jgi:hypothetical protein
MVLWPNNKRRGFKLIDLLIVLAIFVVIGLLSCGAYWRVRVPAGLTNCKNNLRGLGVGIGDCLSSSGNRYPLGVSLKSNLTLYKTIRGAECFGGGPAPTAFPAAYYMCPSRRSPATVSPGQAPADYGWSNSPNSILGSEKPVLASEITDGISKTILLGHTAIRPEDYGGGPWDGPWDSNPTAYARNPAPLYPDKEAPDSTNWMGSPHLAGVPHLFCDGSVRSISYDDSRGKLAEILPLAWQWNRKAGTIDPIGD